MQYALAKLDDGDEIQRWPIEVDEVIIGRSDKATVVIEGGTISRQHVRLWLEDGIVAAEDLGSRNGIKINGVRTRSGSLQNGDQMEVGNHFFVITAVNTPPISLNKGEAPKQAPNPEGRAVQKRAMQNPDVRLNAALVYAARLQPYLFEMDVMLKHIAKIILADIPAQRCYILGKGASSRTMTTLYQAARNGSSDGPALNTTIVDHVLRERKPVIVGDVSELPTLSKEADAKTGIICVPLISNKKSIGVLYIDSGWNPPRFVSANLEDMKAYGLAFGAIIDQAIQVTERLAKARMQGVVQATSALGKCLYEQLHDIREAEGSSETNAFERTMFRSDQAAQQMISLANLHHTSRHPIDANNVIEKALSDVKKELDRKKITVDFQKSTRAIVSGDTHQIHRLIYGILISCIDMCDDSEGSIFISAENKTDGCHVGIRDNGSGMTPTQAENLSTNIIDNAGLGMNGVMLAHAFGVVQSHGGTIKVRSEEGSGTTFSIVLPQQQSATPESEV